MVIQDLLLKQLCHACNTSQGRVWKWKRRGLPKWATFPLKPELQAYAVPRFTLIVSHWPKSATCICSIYCTPCMRYKYCTKSFSWPQKLSSPICEVLLSCRVCFYVFPPGLSVPMLCSEHPWKLWAVSSCQRQPYLSCSCFSTVLHPTSCPCCPPLKTSPEGTRLVLRRTQHIGDYCNVNICYERGKSNLTV